MKIQHFIFRVLCFNLGIALCLSVFNPIYGQNGNKVDSIISNPMKNDRKSFPGVFSVQSDQDFFFHFPSSKNEDRNYTQGTSFVYSHPYLLENWTFFPLKKIEELTRYTIYSASIALVGTAFTPRIIDSITPIVGDRPFAFLLYLSTAVTLENHKNSKPTIYHTFRINYGLFGSNIGYAFQGWAHKYLVTGRPTDPKGWSTQISKGGAPAFLFEYNRFRPLLVLPKAKHRIDDRSLLDLGWNSGGSIGYYDRLYTGLYTRLGHLRNKNQARWNGGLSALNSGSYEMNNPAPVKNKILNILETFVYAKANTTLMFRNAMLVGQGYGNSVYTLKPGWTKVALFELEWGGVIAFEYKKKSRNEAGPRTISVLYRNVYRSPEFDSGIYPKRWHYFGSAGLMFPL